MANKSGIKEIEADISFDDGTTEKISLDSSEFDNIESDEKEKQEATTPAKGVVADEDRKKSKKLPILLAVIVLLLLAGVGGYFLFFHKGANEEVAKTSEKEEELLLPNLKLDGNSLSDFDLDFLKYEIGGKNIVYSPIAIKRTLKMLSDGASGNSKKQIDELLGNYKVENYKNSKNISFANIFFIKEGLKSSTKKEYIDSINKYGAELKAGDLSTASMANSTVKSASLGQVSKMFDFENANSALASSLALNLDWSQYALWCVNGTALPCKNYYEDYYGVVYSSYYNEEYLLEEAKYYESQFGSMMSANYIPIYFTADKYDYVKEKGGEERVKQMIEDDYSSWYWENEADIDDYEKKTGNINAYDEDAAKFAEQYVEKIKHDYGKVASTTDFNFYEDDDIFVFLKNFKKYNNKQLSFVSIMPKGESLKDYIKKTNAEKLLKIIKNIKPFNIEEYKDGHIRKLSLFMPIFKYSYKLDLVGDLKKMGVTKAFEKDNKDLSSIGVDELENIEHKVSVNFSNDGLRESVYKESPKKDEDIYAPVYGNISCDYSKWLKKDSLNIPCEAIEGDDWFYLNKPFLFMILDVTNGEAWYIGAVYKASSTYN